MDERIKIVDIHSHILPCIDDGSPSVEDSLKLLQAEVDEGVTDIIFTPHFRLDMFLTTFDEVLKTFDSFKKIARDNGLNINFYVGQELHYHPDMLGLIKQNKALTLNNSKYVLLEFSWHVKPENAVSIVKEYVLAGFIPIVVHYERFPYYDIKDVLAMKSEGALFQVNAYSIFGVEKEERAKNVKEMLANDCVDFVAGDYHKGKKLLLRDAYKFVSDTFGKELAEKIFYLNALKILGKN